MIRHTSKFFIITLFLSCMPTQALYTTPLETALMLLKAKLLSLARQLGTQEEPFIKTEQKSQWPPEKPEVFWNEMAIKKLNDNDPECEDYIKVLGKLLRASVTNKPEGSNFDLGNLLECYVGKKDNKERLEYLLTNFGDEELKRVFGSRFYTANNGKNYIEVPKITFKTVEDDWQKTEFKRLERLELKKLEENEVRVKLAKKWIRNAAVRVFDDPLRSFLELVVNAADATVQDDDKAVGKFGMGFFSILSFLWLEDRFFDPPEDADKNPLSFTVTTAYRNSKKPKNPIEIYSLTFYKAVNATNDPNNDCIDLAIVPMTANNIQNFGSFFHKILSVRPDQISNILKLKLSDAIIKLSSEKNDQEKKIIFKKLLQELPSGTVVSIDFLKKPQNTFDISTETIKNIQRYAYYLQFYTYAPIVQRVGTKERPINTTTITNTPSIKIILQQDNNDCHPLEVIDAGTGMSLETILFKLLIPSVSTKRKKAKEKTLTDYQKEAYTKKEIKLPELVEFKGKANKKKSYFLITINGVVAVIKELQSLIKNDNNETQDLVVHMPQATQLTLARDELSISEVSDDPNDPTKNFEKSYLKKIINTTIEHVIKNPDKGYIIPALYQGLKEWESLTAARHIYGFFSGFLKDQIQEEIQKKSFIPMPQECAQEFDMTQEPFSLEITPKIPINNELVDYNFSAFEAYLKTTFKKYNEKNKNTFAGEIFEQGITGELIAGLHVYFVPKHVIKPSSFTISQLGTRTSLFVPESYLAIDNASKNLAKASKADLAAYRTAVISSFITKCPPYLKVRSVSTEHKEKNDFIIVTNAQKINSDSKLPTFKKDTDYTLFLESCMRVLNNAELWDDILKDYGISYVKDKKFFIDLKTMCEEKDIRVKPLKEKTSRKKSKGTKLFEAEIFYTFTEPYVAPLSEVLKNSPKTIRKIPKKNTRKTLETYIKNESKNLAELKQKLEELEKKITEEQTTRQKLKNNIEKIKTDINSLKNQILEKETRQNQRQQCISQYNEYVKQWKQQQPVPQNSSLVMAMQQLYENIQLIDQWLFSQPKDLNLQISQREKEIENKRNESKNLEETLQKLQNDKTTQQRKIEDLSEKIEKKNKRIQILSQTPEKTYYRDTIDKAFSEKMDYGAYLFYYKNNKKSYNIYDYYNRHIFDKTSLFHPKDAKGWLTSIFQKLYTDFDITDPTKTYILYNDENIIKNNGNESIIDVFSFLFFYANFLTGKNKDKTYTLTTETKKQHLGFTKENATLYTINDDDKPFDKRLKTNLNIYLAYLNKGIEPVIIRLSKTDTKEKASMIKKYMKNDYRLALTVHEGLKEAIPSIAIPDYLGSIMELLSPLVEEKKSSTKKVWIDMTNSLLGIYNRYFIIPTSLLSSAYGSNEKIEAKPQIKDFANQELLSSLIKILKKKKRLFKKLISFQISDFGLKTNQEMQINDLSQKILYVPTALANTPISLLCKVLEASSSEELITSIIDLSRNPEEYAFICYVVLQETFSKNIKNPIKKEVIDAFKRFIKQYVQEKINPEHIQEIYRKNRKEPAFANRLKNVTTDPAVKVLDDFIQEALDPTKLSIIETDFILQEELKETKWIKENPVFYSANKNIAANCAGTGLLSLLKNNKLEEAKEIIKNADPSSVLGKITQCIEAGSEKSAIEATIIETLQNSIDAIRKLWEEWNKNKTTKKKLQERGQDYSEKDLATIRFKVQMAKAQEPSGRHVTFTIHDTAGFPSLKQLLIDFLLPDYSNKTPKKGNLGDMGNGSFKIYQDAYSVSLLTRLKNDPTKYYWLLVNPKREDGRVIDLDFACEDVSSEMLKNHKNFWGTSIKVIFKPQEQSRVKTGALALQNFLRESISIVRTPLDVVNNKFPFTCIMNNTSNLEEVLNPLPNNDDIIFNYTLLYLTNEEKNIYEKTYQQKYGINPANNHVLFSIAKRKSDLLPSYITTGGIPFRLFNAVAKEMRLLPTNFIAQLSYGFIINLDLSTYAPVQSRTRVSMEPYTQEALRKALFEAYYSIGMSKGQEEASHLDNKEEQEDSFLSKNIAHFYSPVYDVYQLQIKDRKKQVKDELNDFCKGKTSSNTYNEPLFFNYYQSISEKDAPTFFDYLTDQTSLNNKTSLFFILDELEKTCEKERDTAYKSFCEKNKKEIKTCIENSKNAEKNRLILQKKTISKTEDLQNKFKEEKEKIFNTWKNDLLTPEKTTSDKKLIDIIIAWAKYKVDRWNLTFHEWKSQEFLKIPLSKDDNEVDTSVFIEKIMEKDMRFKFNALLRLLFLNFCAAMEECYEKAKKENKTLKGSYKINDIKLFYDDYGDYKTTAGYYKKDTQSIHLNLFINNSYTISNLFGLLQTLVQDNVSIETILSEPGFKKHFEYKAGSATTINHELEHARRGEASDANDTGPHDDALDPNGNLVDFNTCANNYMYTCYQNDLVAQWKKSFNEETRKTISGYLTPKILQAIVNLENKDRELLCNIIIEPQKITKQSDFKAIVKTAKSMPAPTYIVIFDDKKQQVAIDEESVCGPFIVDAQNTNLMIAIKNHFKEETINIPGAIILFNDKKLLPQYTKEAIEKAIAEIQK